MLRFTESGRGETVVLLHGIPGSRATWDDVVPILAPSGRILVPDLLGFGESPDGSPSPHAFEQAAAVAALLERAGGGAAHLVGFDFGGPVAVALRSTRPDLVRSLTLLATNLLSDTPVPLPLRMARVPYLGDLAFRALFSRLGLAAMWRGATADRSAFPLRRFTASLDPRGVVTARNIFLHSLRDLSALYAPLERSLPEIDVPVRVLWGDRDPFFPVAVGRRTASRFRDADLVVLGRCGHFLPQEKPTEVARWIARMIRAEAPALSTIPPS